MASVKSCLYAEYVYITVQVGIALFFIWIAKTLSLSILSSLIIKATEHPAQDA